MPWKCARAEAKTGVKFVAFKSGAEAALSVLGGHVPFTTENLSDYEPIPRPLRNSLAVSALP